MKFILLVVGHIFGGMGGDALSLTTAEFNDLYSCQSAARRLEVLWNEGVNSNTKRLRWECLPKGDPASK